MTGLAFVADQLQSSHYFKQAAGRDHRFASCRSMVILPNYTGANSRISQVSVLLNVPFHCSTILNHDSKPHNRLSVTDYLHVGFAKDIRDRLSSHHRITNTHRRA
jgi:hypothetical protein